MVGSRALMGSITDSTLVAVSDVSISDVGWNRRILQR